MNAFFQLAALKCEMQWAEWGPFVFPRICNYATAIGLGSHDPAPSYKSDLPILLH